jgi:hypothetical protein
MKYPFSKPVDRDFATEAAKLILEAKDFERMEGPKRDLGPNQLAKLRKLVSFQRANDLVIKSDENATAIAVAAMAQNPDSMVGNAVRLRSVKL